MKAKKTVTGIGLMSGTSLDGLDMAACSFLQNEPGSWSFRILQAETIAYPEHWRKKLQEAHSLSGLELLMLHKEYGSYLGGHAANFIRNYRINADFISSHGHTIFHQPAQRFTFQLGDGAFIAAQAGITTVSDFRNLDVALGGQGAPLVPTGDIHLFPDYDQYLNLGGFSNISYREEGKVYAFDISPVNIVLNHFTSQYFSQPFDKDGELGQQGQVNPDLLDQLNSLPYYNQATPKSLGWEWVYQEFLPLLEKDMSSKQNQLRTLYEHFAIQIGTCIQKNPGAKVLVTGGGAYNKFLIRLITQQCTRELILPDKMVIEYKEALIFAFLGWLRIQGMDNCLATVTGAAHNNLGGIIHPIR